MATVHTSIQTALITVQSVKKINVTKLADNSTTITKVTPVHFSDQNDNPLWVTQMMHCLTYGLL